MKSAIEESLQEMSVTMRWQGLTTILPAPRFLPGDRLYLKRAGDPPEDWELIELNGMKLNYASQWEFTAWDAEFLGAEYESLSADELATEAEREEAMAAGSAAEDIQVVEPAA